jgi:hypothetical protein
MFSFSAATVEKMFAAILLVVNALCDVVKII